MKRIIFFLILIICTFRAGAQLHFSFSHYTADHGLSQNSLTAMYKDHKGYLWLCTRDGLNRFDGKTFKSYNSNFYKYFSGSSNRFLDIKEDVNGFLWLRSYDDILYRFHPDTEMFEDAKHLAGSGFNEKIKQFFVLPSGNVWFTTYRYGCYRIKTTEKTKGLSAKAFNTGLKNVPSDFIEKIFEDNAGITWILTLKGLVSVGKNDDQLLRFNGIPFYSSAEDKNQIVFGSQGKIYIYNKTNQSFKIADIPSGLVVNEIKLVYPNFYVLSAENKGFLTFNTVKNELQHFTVEKFPSLKSNHLQQIYIDKAGDVWFGLKASGVVRYQPRTNQIEFLAAESTVEKTTNPNMLFAEDEKDVLWVQSYYGSFSWYDRKNNKLTPFRNMYNYDINVFLRYGVNHVIADDHGVLWLSTNRGNGLFKCTFLPEYFTHYLPDKNSVYNIANEVRAIFEDNMQRLWVASKEGVVRIYDKNKKLIGTLDKSGQIRNGAYTDILVYNIFQDKTGVIWLSTKQQGIFRLKPTASPLKFLVENFQHSSDKYSPANNDFYSITQDKSGRLWAGSYGGGIHLIDLSAGKIRFIHSGNDLKNYPIDYCSKVRQVFVDSNNQIWLATTEGFLNFNANESDFTKIKFNYYQNKNNIPDGIAAKDILFIEEDTEKRIWVASFGGGFAMLKNKNFQNKEPELLKFDLVDGLPGRIFYTITDDKQGNLWITAESAIIKFVKKTKSIEVYGKGNEIEDVEFSESASLLLKSGEICVGSKSGFYIFEPSLVKRKVLNVPVVFTGLKVMNKDVEVSENSILTKQLDNLSEIEFTHKQNVFTIEFAALDMRAPEKIQYSYMLEGFDKEWNNVGTRSNATYTSLPPGKYVFRVKSTDSEGVWLDNERNVKVRILPSFWQSIYAKIIYSVLIIGLFVLAFYIFMTIFKLKNNILFEQQMTDMKLRFFTDISHELRTPLTLISLPVDNVLKENVDPYVRDQMVSVRNNLDKVMTLINKILDFRKLQNNKMQLNIEELDFGEFVSKCSVNLTQMAIAKNLIFDIDIKCNGLKIWADPEQLESIIQNLITNAIKFTPAGKKVNVIAELKDNKAVLSVVDEGIGIPQDKINFIFERFFSNNTLKSIWQKSTGIGLDIVKKMVELHHAEMQVDSVPNAGSSFIVSFKTGSFHFNDDINVSFTEKLQQPDRKLVEMPVEIHSEHDDNDDHQNPLILIVEDNDELRHYLSMSLRGSYRVAEAVDGKKAWAKIEAIQPDIIIADLRMPVMDGLELTKLIKEDQKTSHIPVILLTAVTDMDSKMEGLRIGADDYITKPFNSQFLFARIENLLIQRKKLQQYFRNQIGTELVDSNLVPLVENKSTENSFMKKLFDLMEEHLENFDLNVEMLSSEFNMSRTIFFTKLKSLTGLSPVEFIREARLQKAAKLMLNTELTVSEISYKVGIEDPRYFSRIFKLRFGETPTDFRQSNIK